MFNLFQLLWLMVSRIVGWTFIYLNWKIKKAYSYFCQQVKPKDLSAWSPYLNGNWLHGLTVGAFYTCFLREYGYTVLTLV